MTIRPVLTLSDQADDALRAVIVDNFDAHSLAAGVPSDFRLLAIRMERDGALLGGLMGRTGRGWLAVEYLALPMAEQGRGFGRQLMAMAESEAVQRGCHSAFLNTIAFQAPGFYQKLGYREFARLEDDNPALSRIWFRKRLA